MIIALLVLSGLLVSSLLILLARFHRKIRRQAKQLFLQGQEIKKHLLELQQQNNQLAELNKEKQHLFSVVSHDFKGPFNRIFALVQLLSLSGDALTDEQRDYLGKIHLIVADGLNMLRNLLDNRKLEEKGIELRPETLNVTAVIASLIKNYSVIAAKKKIQIHSEAPPRLFLVMDKACLTRITDNLISNAIKFSPPQRQVWVSVRDEA